MNTKDLVIGERHFCLFKGEPATGKSAAASSYPDPYILDLDRRIASVKNFWRHVMKQPREFEYDQFDNFFKLHEKLEQLKQLCQFKTIVFDGITTAGDVILRTMRETRDPKAKKIMYGGIEILQIEDYLGESNGLQMLLDDLEIIALKWGVHVIVIAHVLKTSEKDIKSKVTTESRTLLTAGKKIAAKLPIRFDECWHFDVQSAIEVSGAPTFRIMTNHAGDDWAKTALPIPMFIDFTRKSLYDEVMRHVRAANEVKIL